LRKEANYNEKKPITSSKSLFITMTDVDLIDKFEAAQEEGLKG